MMPRAPAAALIALCAACTGAAAVHAADSGDLDQLMHLLAMRQHGQVDFVEQQFIAILDHPVESSGILRYDAPDRLEKRTLKPHAQSLVLTGGTLTVERGHNRRVLDLHSYPQALPFVESIRATLAGDRGALERVFHVEFSGELAHWSLKLVPLDSQMAKSVAQVRIEGSQDQLQNVEIKQPDGDRSLMTLRPTAAP
jgi:Outer membrane lipoprotein carrier protein LolA-like